MKVFTYQDYLKVIEIREKMVIRGIKTRENNNFGMLCLRKDKEEYNIGQVDTEKNIVSKKQMKIKNQT